MIEVNAAQTDLDDACVVRRRAGTAQSQRTVLTAEHAEISLILQAETAFIPGRIAPLHVIQDVERLHEQLHPDPFGEPGVFGKSQVQRFHRICPVHAEYPRSPVRPSTPSMKGRYCA